MLITHKNTATLGDFSFTWPLLSSLSQKYGPLDISLPDNYRRYKGLKELLEYQDFCKSVDFLDREGDIDVQARGSNINKYPILYYYSANLLNENIDENLIIKIPELETDDSINNKVIIFDRMRNYCIKNHNIKIYNSYYSNYDKSIIYDLNLAKKNKNKIISTTTGISALLSLAMIPHTVLYFDDVSSKNDLLTHLYFSNRNIEFIYYKDFIKSNYENFHIDS